MPEGLLHLSELQLETIEQATLDPIRFSEEGVQVVEGEEFPFKPVHKIKAPSHTLDELIASVRRH